MLVLFGIGITPILSLEIKNMYKDSGGRYRG